LDVFVSGRGLGDKVLSKQAYKDALDLKPPMDIAATLRISTQSVCNLKRRFLEGGLKAALYDQQRCGRPVEIDGKQRAKVTALACSVPPDGHARWTLRLLADKAVELGYCETLSHTGARQILKKMNSDRI
jgi:putative transposase